MNSGIKWALFGTWSLAIVMLVLMLSDRIIDHRRAARCVLTDSPDELREFQRACFATPGKRISLTEIIDGEGASHWQMICESDRLYQHHDEEKGNEIRTQTGC